MALSGVIGSGWLLAGQTAAQHAGPLAVVSWVIGAGALGLVGAVMVRLAVARPQSGGLVRWPSDSSGRTVGTIIAAALIVVYSANAPIESAAVVQALGFRTGSRFVTFDNSHAAHLTNAGLAVAVGVMTVLFVINWFGLRLVAGVNTVLTVLKFVVPVAVIVVIALVAFHPSNLTEHGGLHPFGFAPALGVITTAGVVFAYTGFQGPIDHAGEADRTKIRWAVGVALIVSAIIYTLLQLVYVGAVPNSWFSGGGWNTVGHSAPVVHLAQDTGPAVLVLVLFVDSMLSPFATALVFVSFTSAGLQASGEKRVIAWSRMARTYGRRNVPRVALLLNYVVGLALLLVLKDWQPIVGATSLLALFIYAYPAISYTVFRVASNQAARETGAAYDDHYRRGMHLFAPASFAVATVLAYYAGWPTLWKALCFMFGLAAIMFVGGLRIIDADARKHQLRSLWLVGYFVLLLGLSAFGRYQGVWKVIPQPFDGIAAFALGVAAYYLGVGESLRFRRSIRADPRS
jgi:amino acid transporter